MNSSGRSGVSVLFSEPKIPQRRRGAAANTERDVSVLFSEPKIPQCGSIANTTSEKGVSVLFSEPKIPQRPRRAYRNVALRFQCSSASRKFLNVRPMPSGRASSRFQCSSASRKFLNSFSSPRTPSATAVSVLFSEPKIPQRRPAARRVPTTRRFSALQRAENSSM